jgi:hypothetical protein
MTLIVGKVIQMPAMRKGLCRYVNKRKDGSIFEETILLGQVALEKMSVTIRGVPVVIDHQIIDPANIEQLKMGRVADMHYDTEKDLWDAHFVVDDEKAVEKLKAGWGVSTAYRITQSGPGGKYNNVPYDREVLDAVYDHLAIVESPRYEMARDPVFWNSKDPLIPEVDGDTIDNSNQKRGGTMLGKFWRLVNQEFKTNSDEELMVLVDGQELKLNDIVSTLHELEMKKNMKKVVMNGTDTVEYNGNKMTVNELVDMFKSMGKENAAFEGKETPEEEAEEEKIRLENEAKEIEEKEKKENEAKEIEEKEKKENEAKEIEEKEKKENEAKEIEEKEKKENEAKEADEKKNAAELRDIKNNGVAVAPPQWLSVDDRIAEGRKLYGSK